MLNLIRRRGFIALIAILLPTGAIPEPAAKDFVRVQAAKAAFVTDVAKVNRYAADMFRVASYAVLRMTHQHWEFDIDTTIKNAGQTYAWKVRSNAEDSEYDVRRFEVALSRNEFAAEDVKVRAQEMVDLIEQLIAHSLELANIYETGDVTLAGDHFYEKIIPVYEAIRRGEATISSELAGEIKLDAAKF